MKEEKELSPVEIWDSLAVRQIIKQLAPTGFKKIHNNKREVVATQFVTKETVNNACIISANMVRLYRENLREKLKSIITDVDAWITEDEKKLSACRFWEVGKKTDLKYKIRSLRGQGGSASRILNELDQIKPTSPKVKVQPKMEVAK